MEMAIRKNLALLILLLFIVSTTVSAGAYQEAPVLAERVAKGELSPLEERLPEEPMVVQPVNSIGKYGGTWRRLCIAGWDTTLGASMGYESLVRWDRSGVRVVPGIAKSWDILDGGKTYVFHLRKGIRWSDGVPFTSEDIVFMCEDVLNNKAIYPIFPRWFIIDDKPMEVSAPDPFTIVFHFAKPYGIFLEVLAVRGLQNWLFGPKHYLKQFHEKYADPDELQKEVRKAGFESWSQLFGLKEQVAQNPELPTLCPFIVKIPPPSTRIVAERNPYYWKVDPEGNQLPYIDRVAFTVVDNSEVLNFKAMAGDLDFQARRIDTANFSLFMENRKKGNYHILRDYSPDTAVIYVNQCSQDPRMRGLLQDRRFRIALSVAINREEVIDLIYQGMAVPSRGVSWPGDPYYLPEYNQKYLEYDPELANRLLDELGMEEGFSGMRRMPDGTPFKQIISVYPSELGTTIDLWQLVAAHFREVGLDFVVKIDAPSLSHLQLIAGNTNFWAYQVWFMHWVVDPQYYFPMSTLTYIAPLFGQYVSTFGKRGIEPPEEYMRMTNWYHDLRSEMNEARRVEFGQRIMKQWAEESYVIGICRPELLTIVKNNFGNVPEHVIHSWTTRTPGYLNIEQFYFDNPEGKFEGATMH